MMRIKHIKVLEILTGIKQVLTGYKQVPTGIKQALTGIKQVLYSGFIDVVHTGISEAQLQKKYCKVLRMVLYSYYVL